MAETAELAPPYAPFDTFRTFIESLSKTAVPPHIDRSLLPKMSGGAQAQIISALKFLKLIGSSGDTQESLRALVKSFGTPAWKETLCDIIFDAYSDITNDIDLDAGSSKQLRDAFRDRGHVDGQMLEKAVRFFIKAMSEAGTTFSPHFKTRQSTPRMVGDAARTPKTKPAAVAQGQATDGAPKRQTQPGMMAIPIYLPGKPVGEVIVPEDVSEADCVMIDSILRAYAKRREADGAKT